jgi:hypothetical protein
VRRGAGQAGGLEVGIECWSGANGHGTICRARQAAVTKRGQGTLVNSRREKTGLTSRTPGGAGYDSILADETTNHIDLHIPYQFLGETPESDYFPTALAITEFVGRPFLPTLQHGQVGKPAARAAAWHDWPADSRHSSARVTTRRFPTASAYRTSVSIVGLGR